MNTILCSKTKEINQFARHAHPNAWEISIHLVGDSKIVMDDICYDINKYDVRVLPPSVIHEGLPGSYFSDIYLHAKNLDFSNITVCHDYDGSILRLFKMLDKIMTEKEENYANIADTLTDAICQYIKKYSKSEFKYDFVISFKNTLYHNISNANFSISDEIKQLGFNTDYFRRCFKEELHKTPLKYLTDLRIEYAKKLLKQDTFHSIENVSSQCGFNDSFYFSKMFKKCTGISPKDYRKNNLE